MSELIGKDILEDVPPHFHYLACWALAQGAVELWFNQELELSHRYQRADGVYLEYWRYHG